MLEKLFRRIYVSPEERVLKMTLDHADKCRNAAKRLREALEEALREGDVKRKIAEVEQAERDADKLRREILDYLAEGALPPLSREDFVRLAERVDSIADWSREAVRVLKVICGEVNLTKLGDPLIKLASHAEEASEKLYEAIKAMSEDLKKARDLVAEVERIEDRGDWAYADCLVYISKLWGEMQSPLVLLLVQYVENVVDAAEDASDVLEEIIIRALR